MCSLENCKLYVNHHPSFYMKNPTKLNCPISKSPIFAKSSPRHFSIRWSRPRAQRRTSYLKNPSPHVILPFENRSFHQDRPPEISFKNIRPHVILAFEHRSSHQKRPPEFGNANVFSRLWTSTFLEDRPPMFFKMNRTKSGGPGILRWLWKKQCATMWTYISLIQKGQFSQHRPWARAARKLFQCTTVTPFSYG